ncbi:hypothetical protein N9Y89_02060 [bacterium]|nr:hypothetical protein [bacterium]
MRIRKALLIRRLNGYLERFVYLDITDKESFISKRKLAIKEAEELVKKYNKQLESIKNNREYDSLSKEIEFQNLEIELANKKIKDNLACLFSFLILEKHVSLPKKRYI